MKLLVFGLLVAAVNCLLTKTLQEKYEAKVIK
jgi:hypothetical protein